MVKGPVGPWLVVGWVGGAGAVAAASISDLMMVPIPSWVAALAPADPASSGWGGAVFGGSWHTMGYLMGYRLGRDAAYNQLNDCI